MVRQRGVGGRSKRPTPLTRDAVLRATLAWDLAHEFVLGSGVVHLRHVQRTTLCQADAGPCVETTPYGDGNLCPDCAEQVPEYVCWVEPTFRGSLTIEQLADHLGVEIILSNDRPETNDTGAAPCGAILAEPFEDLRLYVGHHNGVMQTVHRVGALHELAHVVCAPHGFDSESACGLYAVQYALARLVERGRPLRSSTKDMQGLRCRVYGGLMQARAYALGFLDEGRSVAWRNMGLANPAIVLR